MGNWMRVKIEGSCNREEVTALAKALDSGKDYENLHCLTCGGICGLPNWAAESIHAVGNLAERGYTPDDIREQLEALAKVAPSLSVTVHCGGEYESDKCISTVIVIEGIATVVAPAIPEIPQVPASQLKANLFSQLARHNRRV